MGCDHLSGLWRDRSVQVQAAPDGQAPEAPGEGRPQVPPHHLRHGRPRLWQRDAVQEHGEQIRLLPRGAGPAAAAGGAAGHLAGQQIRDIMLQGLLVPTGVILDIVSDSLLSRPGTRGFLVDGFPRELTQAKEFERIVGRAPNVMIGFDCSMETMVRRALHRGRLEQRADDSEPAIRRRLETHYTLAEPVLAFYQKNLLRNILAEEAPENIFGKCSSVIESLQ
ncbi:adenylate kinase isoenzyme 1-like [Dasypus novemcinctus]|uniref:adenylate kinase isoenzyme 1-like n=1 Tax=Dasypus novemcinctus TaxID=9361 RepID=UPI00265DEF85|nr:adenylate kinase isoenzyme 1-like [Dasypus novemcinctus]